jgi:hypothetical protein
MTIQIKVLLVVIIADVAILALSVAKRWIAPLTPEGRAKLREARFGLRFRDWFVGVAATGVHGIQFISLVHSRKIDVSYANGVRCQNCAGRSSSIVFGSRSYLFVWVVGIRFGSHVVDLRNAAADSDAVPSVRKVGLEDPKKGPL